MRALLAQLLFLLLTHSINLFHMAPWCVEVCCVHVFAIVYSFLRNSVQMHVYMSFKCNYQPLALPDGVNVRI